MILVGAVLLLADRNVADHLIGAFFCFFQHKAIYLIPYLPLPFARGEGRIRKDRIAHKNGHIRFSEAGKEAPRLCVRREKGEGGSIEFYGITKGGVGKGAHARIIRPDMCLRVNRDVVAVLATKSPPNHTKKKTQGSQKPPRVCAEVCASGSAHNSAPLGVGFAFLLVSGACAWLGGAQRRRLVSRQAHVPQPRPLQSCSFLDSLVSRQAHAPCSLPLRKLTVVYALYQDKRTPHRQAPYTGLFLWTAV